MKNHENNNSERTHEINDKNTMTIEEMAELFNWMNGEMIKGENS